jgi:hypothetical protein
MSECDYEDDDGATCDSKTDINTVHAVNKCGSVQCQRIKAGRPANDGELSLCRRCRITYYCSRECQRKAWPLHKRVCKVLPSSHVKLVQTLREAIATVKNTPGLARDLLRDAREEYHKGSFFARSSSAVSDPLCHTITMAEMGQRGVMIFDSAGQTETTDASRKASKSVGLKAVPLTFKYVGADDPFLTHTGRAENDPFADLKSMMQKYDPQAEFVLMALHSEDPDSDTRGGPMHIFDVIKPSASTALLTEAPIFL